MKIFTKIILLLSIIALSGCAAFSTAVSKRNLQVETKMQNSIFLNPVDEDNKTIFLQIKNTSDQQSFNITNLLSQDLQQKGYMIVTNPSAAHYVLQINILQAGKTSKTALEKSPFGTLDAVGLGVAGAAVGGRHGNIGGTIVGGVIGAGAAVLADSLVEDVYCSVTADLRISEHNTTTAQTRITSFANKVNLKWEAAQPELQKVLAEAISGIF
jgi:hypothetical protein